MASEDLEFPTGIRLLAAWQAGDQQAAARLKSIFDATMEGQYDDEFRRPAPQNVVHISGSIDLLTLDIMHQLYGLTTAEFYKCDPQRYVRSVLVTLKLLGMPKLYLSWPVYALTAEALGQPMMYSDKFSPGTDPENPFVNSSNWQEVSTPDMETGIPRLLTEVLDCYQQLTGFNPVLHLSAPYSLAADIYGQEPLINALTHEPEFVNTFLDHLADQVLTPWAEHFFDRFPNGWLELSDASGSPFFIGPRNCKDVAIRSVQRFIDGNSWEGRVYIANYRGDHVAQSGGKNKPSTRPRSRRSRKPEQISLAELQVLKHSVCRGFVIGLRDDNMPASYYLEQAIEQHVPLFLGIGATQIDRNSIGDMEMARKTIQTFASENVEAIKTVARTIGKNGYSSRIPPWPGTVYFEDISAESSFELIEVIVDTALKQGVL